MNVIEKTKKMWFSVSMTFLFAILTHALTYYKSETQDYSIWNLLTGFCFQSLLTSQNSSFISMSSTFQT